MKIARTPDLTLVGLRLWVHGRQFEGLTDYWDGNWLRVTAECQYPGSRVTKDGPILHLSEIVKWLSECRAVYATLEGTACLHCMEPYLDVELAISDRLGHLTVKIALTPDHMSQQHEFSDEIDQSVLPSLIAALEGILEQYPLRGTP